MQYDHDKIDEMVLALMSLGIHDFDRAWKSFDWDSMDRLHQKGLKPVLIGIILSKNIKKAALNEVNFASRKG